MKTFRAILKMNIKKEFAYKVSALSGMVTQFFFGFMQIALYTSFLAGGQSDFSTIQMASYIWLQQAFYTMFKFWDSQKYEISYKIVSGDIGYQLIRPMNLYSYWYANVYSKSLGMFLIRAIPIFLVVFWLPAGVGLMLPATFENFLLFVLSAVIGGFLVTSINMICYVIVLYTLSPAGVFSFSVAVSGFLSGQCVPIPMLPITLQKIMNFFPFRYISDLPFRIYIGNINGTDALIQIAIQIAWLVAIVLVGRLVMAKKLNNLTVQGG